MTFLTKELANRSKLSERAMSNSGSPVPLDSFSTFGDLLKYLRRRARLTQRELSIAVKYSEAQISRLEQNLRPPDLAALTALFIPALFVEDEPEIVARLIELATQARGQELPQGIVTFSRSVQHQVLESSRTIEENIRNNLPLQLTSFVGREFEIAEIKKLFSKARLITLTGSGGCGKTRLALETARQLVDSYRDGIWLIELASIFDAALVLQAVTSTLGIPESRDNSQINSLKKYLLTKHILLIFDNCEQVISGTAQLVEEILRACPHVQFLATSREILNSPGEVRFRVPSLSLPQDESLSSDVFSQFESVRLFVERAQTAFPSFALNKDNTLAVAQICRRLDGMPLAIELAAARVTILSTQQIAGRLDNSFQLLTGGSATLPRHQTLQATIEWSYELLSEAERLLLKRLSIFSGGWTLEAAESVVSDPSFASTGNILDLVSQLVNKSLLTVEWQSGVETRYTMLQTIHEFAREKLRATGEMETMRARHFDFFCSLAQHIGSKVFGPEKGIWLNRIESDIDNFRAALAWSLEADPAGILPPLTERAEKAIQLIGSLLDFYWCRGYLVEAREWLDRLLIVDMPLSRVRTMGFQKAGWLTRASGDFEKAVALLNQALTMSREIGDKYRIGMSLADLGMVARDQGDSGQAIDYFSEALSLFQEVEDKPGMGNTFYYLAEMQMLNGDLENARRLWEQGLDLFRQAGDKSHAAWGLQGLGDIAFLKGELAQATALHWEGLKYLFDVMDQPNIAISFEALGQVAAAQQQPERAAVLWGAAGQLRQVLDIPLKPFRQSFYIPLIPTARDQLGDDLFEAAWAKGRRLTLAQAVEYALKVSSV